MKPLNLIWQNQNRKWIEIAWGGNCSLVRNSEKDCVIAYYKTDVITYMVIKCSKRNFKVYRAAEFQTKLYGEEIIRMKDIVPSQELLQPTKELKHLTQLKWKVVDKKEFKRFNKELLVEAL